MCLRRRYGLIYVLCVSGWEVDGGLVFSVRVAVCARSCVCLPFVYDCVNLFGVLFTAHGCLCVHVCFFCMVVV